MTRFRRSLAFTLIELLVVISIIALLIGLLLPALGQARALAKVAQCLSNQKGMGVGYYGYISDYQKLPGNNYTEGYYLSMQWGTGFWGQGSLVPSTMQAWMSTAPIGDPLTYNHGVLYPNYGAAYPLSGVSTYSGIGYVQPYVGENGKIFYCPGTTVSFGANPMQTPYPAGWGNWEGNTLGKPWYSTWVGDPAFSGFGGETPYGFGKPGCGTLITYMYRGTSFEKDPYLPTPSDWGYLWTNQNWPTGGQYSSPDSKYMVDRPMLSDFWLATWYFDPNYTASGGNSAGPKLGHKETLNHGIDKCNLLYTDGSAKTWHLPSDLGPISTQFSYGGGPASFNPDAYWSQHPYWWVRADIGK